MLFNKQELPTTMQGVINPLGDKVDIDAWAKEAGMDWEVRTSKLLYNTQKGSKVFQNRNVAFRSDTLAPLGIISDNFSMVQPRTILSFFQNLVDVGGYKLESAGTFKGGKRLWAMARTSEEAVIGKNDHMLGYLLLATGVDGNMSTQVFFTSIRIACLNALNVAFEASSGPFIRIPHMQEFDKDEIILRLGSAKEEWSNFTDTCKALSSRLVQKQEAIEFFLKLLYPEGELIDLEDRRKRKLFQIMDVYEKGIGQDMITTKNTAFGLVNAVSRFVDHEAQSRSNANRLESGWIGSGANLKNKALIQAQELLAA